MRVRDTGWENSSSAAPRSGVSARTPMSERGQRDEQQHQLHQRGRGAREVLDAVPPERM